MPAGLAVAVLGRAGHWEDALKFYRERIPKKVRRVSVEADLLAAAGFAALRNSSRALARERFGLALQLSDRSLLARAGYAALDINRPVKLESPEWPWALLRTDETFQIVPSSHSIEGQASPHNEERTEVVVNGERWRASISNVANALDSDDPNVWHSELKECLEVFKKVERVSIKGYCSCCGYEAEAPMLVCRRCDNIGLMVAQVPLHLKTPVASTETGRTELTALLLEEN